MMTEQKPEPATEKDEAKAQDAVPDDGLADYGSAGQSAVDGVRAEKGGKTA